MGSLFFCRIQRFSLRLEVNFGCCSLTVVNIYLCTDYSIIGAFMALLR